MPGVLIDDDCLRPRPIATSDPDALLLFVAAAAVLRPAMFFNI